MTATRLGKLVLGILAVSACNTDDSHAPVAVLDLVLIPATPTVAQGVTGSTRARLTRRGGFTGPVLLAITGLPTGVTGTISPELLAPGVVDATIELAVAVDVPAGPYSATVTASADGGPDETATLELTVSESGFVLSMSPGNLTIVAGGSSGASVNIIRTAFGQDVLLELVNPPDGISGAFLSTPTSTGASLLVLDVAAHTAPGTYTLAIRGTASGPRSQNAGITVRVPSSPSGGNVAFRFCSVDETPVFVARQDGAGAWEVVASSAQGDTTQFVLDIAQGWGGVLMVYHADAPAARRSGRLQPQARSAVLRRRTHAGRTDASFRATASAAVSTQYETQLVYGSTAQLAQIGLESCTSATSLRTHAVTLRNVSPGEYGIASLGGVTRILDGSAPVFPLWFEDVPAGPVDLFASRTVPGGPASRVLIVRDLELESGSLVTTNFNGTASDTAKTAAVEIAGASGDDLEVFTDLVTKNSHGGLWFDLAPGPATVRTWSGLPTEAMQHGEFHSLVVFATPVGSDDFRYVQKHVIPVSFQSLALGPAINAPVSTQVTGDPHPRFRFTGDLGNLYTGSVIIEVLPSHEAGNAFNIHATGAYLAAAGTQQAYDFTMPDVTGLAGYPTASRLTTGANRVTVSAFEFTGPGIFEVQPIPGTMIRASVRNITVIVP